MAVIMFLLLGLGVGLTAYLLIQEETYSRSRKDYDEEWDEDF